MKPRFFGQFCLMLSAWCVGLAAISAAEPRTDACVVLVSIDGLANFYLDDPRADMPTLRRMMREGARADGMLCSFPTVTWPNHTTLVTGVTPARHGVLGNQVLNRETGKVQSLLLDPVFDKEQIVRAPTIYDAAHRAGLKTAGIIWPSTRGASSIDWNMPDMATYEHWQQHGTRSWLEEMRTAGLPVEQVGKWFKEPTGACSEIGCIRAWRDTC